MDQSDDFDSPSTAPRICDAHVLQIVVCAVLPENVAASTRQNPPRVVGVFVIPEDGRSPRDVAF